MVAHLVRGKALECARSPDAYESACDSMEVTKGCCGPLVARDKNQRKVETGITAEFASMPRRYVRRMNL